MRIYREAFFSQKKARIIMNKKQDKKTENMATLVTRTQLAAVLGKSAATVSNWQYKGCPCIMVKVGKSGARKVPYFEIDAVKSWLLEKYNLNN